MRQQHAERVRLISFLTLGFSLVLLFACLTSSSAQTVPITSSGLNTGVSPPTTLPSGKVQYDITGGTRPGGGANLFHSFGDFNVPISNIANFLNAGSIDPGNPNVILPSGLPTSNILGRINGGNPSSIFGMIQTNGPGGFPNANLFLMNPTGFLFGPNATVQVSGMVSFTSADYLRLADNARFNAVPGSADALLTAVPVAAFGFLGSNPGAITVQGSQLTVTPRESISLVGGNVTIQSATLDDGTIQPAKLSALGGQINLASVASPGEILTATLAQGPNINGQSFGDLGAIQISEQSLIDASGNGGGTVLIRGGNFVLDNSTISANVSGSGLIMNGVESIGSGIDIQVSEKAVIQNLGVLETNVTGNATLGVTYGGVDVKADRIEILGTVTLEDAFAGTGDFSAFTGIRSNVSPGSIGGNSGAITLETNSILANNFATLEARTEGAGNGGNIIVRADQNLEIDFGFVQSGATFSTGDAGNIELTSAHGNISTNFAFITSQTVQSPGTAGNLTLNAPSGNILIGDGSTLFTLIDPPINPDRVAAVRAGGSGGILINANNLEVIGSEMGITNGSNLLSGNLTVNLSGNLSLRGGSFGPSFIRALAQQPVDSTGLPLTAHGADSAGLNITAHDILITDGSSITTSTLTSGAAGPLNISAVNLQLTNGGQISSASRQGIDFQTGLPFGPPPSGPAGTVTIQGLSGPAQSVLIDGQGSGILTNTVGTGAGGNIFVNANSVTLQNGGTLSATTSGPSATATGGTITIEGGQVQLSGGALVSSATFGPGAGGTIHVAADAVTLTGVSADFQAATKISAETFSADPGAGAAGDIVVATGTLTVEGGAGISSSTVGHGDGGTIQVTATEAVTLSGGSVNPHTVSSSTGEVEQLGFASGLFTDALGGAPGSGAAGDIVVTTGTLTVEGGAGISSSTVGHGDGGTIQVTADAVTLAGTNSDGRISSGLQALSLGDLAPPFFGIQGSGTGAAGDIVVATGTLTVEGGANISTSTFGPGAGGKIQVTATEAVTLAGGNPALDNPDAQDVSGLFAQTGGFKPGAGDGGTVTLTSPVLNMDGSTIITSTSSSGNAGSITLNVGSATLTNNATITSSSTGPATGAAGNVTIQNQGGLAQSVLIDGTGSGIFTDTNGTGAGGNILVAANSVTLQNRAQVSSSSTGTGIAGDITINAGNQFAMTNSSVTTEANQSSGGAIKITTNPEGTVLLTDSTISASVLNGEGGGGSVNIDPQFVILQNSQILADAVFGPGGNIFITTNLLLPDSASVISASSQFGQQGTISIQSPISPASGKINPIGQRPLIPVSMVSQRCAALAGGNVSSFTVAGRDNLPAEPGGWLSSPLALVMADSGSSEIGPPKSQSEPLGDTPLISLRRIAPPGFLTQSFAKDWLKGCVS